MKTQRMVIGILVAVVLSVGLGYERGWAKGKAEIAPAKVAVVSVDRILENSKKHAQWRAKMETRQDKVRAELQKLSKEIEAIKADMNTRKVGSSDYLRLAREGMEKKAIIEAKGQFHEQEMTLQAQQWTEQLYQEIVATVGKVAKDMGLDLVITKQELQFPSSSIRELMLTVRTNQVLYNSDAMDITNDVLAILDSTR